MRLTKYIIILSLFLFSCKKDIVENKVVVNQLHQGALVLNEGLFQQNNSSLSWVDYYDYSTQNEFFELKSGRKLGDTGNDMQQYGGKIYVVVTVVVAIFIGLVLFMWNMERRLKKIEDQIEN